MALMERGTAAGVQALRINSFRSDWTPVLVGLPEPQMRAKGGPGGRLRHSFRSHPAPVEASVERRGLRRLKGRAGSLQRIVLDISSGSETLNQVLDVSV